MDENVPNNSNCVVNIEHIKVEPLDEPQQHTPEVKIEIEVEPTTEYGENGLQVPGNIDTFKTDEVFSTTQIKIEPDDEDDNDVPSDDEMDPDFVNRSVDKSMVQKPMFIEVEIKPLSYIDEKNKLYFHPKCEMITPTTSNLGAHVQTCDLCQKTFTSVRTLNIHKKYHKFTCDICGKDIKTKQDLVSHFETHNRNDATNAEVSFVESENKFRCNLCNKLFVTRSGLNKHRKLHLGNMYKCDICYKQFTEKGNLTCHKRIHTGEKPYQCPVCNRGFAQKSSLNSHVKNHDEIKPFACTVCNKEFCKKRNLTIHEHIHREVKPFKCDICNKQFSQVSVN